MFTFFELIPATLVPIVIFVARIFDVSLGTIRIMYVARGMRTQAAVLGFFEVLIWILVVGQIMQNLDDIANFIAFAGGFAAGNYVGILIENKLKIGTLIYRVITQKDPRELIETLREQGFGVTQVAGEGKDGEVNIIFTIVKRKQWQLVQELIESYVPKAFYSVEEVKHVSNGPGMQPPAHMSTFTSLLRLRKKV